VEAATVASRRDQQQLCLSLSCRCSWSMRRLASSAVNNRSEGKQTETTVALIQLFHATFVNTDASVYTVKSARPTVVVNYFT
jgi:hypothetical protein